MKNKYNQLREEINKAILNEKVLETMGDVYPLKENLTLEDCLIALRKLKIGSERTYCAECENCIEEEILLKKWIPNVPLQDQSDEVHNLLWELICKK